MNEPRNWKWIVPAAAVPVLFVLAIAINEFFGKFPIMVLFGCQFGLVALMLIAIVAAVSNYRNYFGWEEMERFRMRQQALNTTPITLLADSLKQMHPEAVRVLNRFGVRTSWQVKVGRGPEDLDWILLDTNVHMAFVEYFLENSNTISVMAKRGLSEGAYHYDQDKLVTDYEQYDQFTAWLLTRMMVTRPFGNVPPQWMPPWNPQAVMEIMGLTQREYELQEGKEDEEMSNVAR